MSGVEVRVLWKHLSSGSQGLRILAGMCTSSQPLTRLPLYTVGFGSGPCPRVLRDWSTVTSTSTREDGLLLNPLTFFPRVFVLPGESKSRTPSQGETVSDRNTGHRLSFFYNGQSPKKVSSMGVDKKDLERG